MQGWWWKFKWMILFTVDNCFPFSVLIIFISSGPVHFTKGFQYTCIFKWGVRKVSKHKGIFEGIICDCRQMAENTDSSKDYQHIFSLQKSNETHLPSLVIMLEREAGHQFSPGPTEYSEDLISSTTWVMFNSPFFSYTHLTHQKGTHEELK